MEDAWRIKELNWRVRKEAIMSRPGSNQAGSARRSTGRPRGRPRSIGVELQALLEQGGYSVDGVGKIRRSKSRFLDLEAASIRFNLLDEEWRAMAGSPGGLLEACRLAYRRLKSCNRRSITTSLDDCLAEVLMEMGGCFAEEAEGDARTSGAKT